MMIQLWRNTGILVPVLAVTGGFYVFGNGKNKK